jgi:uroporphyrinogen decarboxylase
MADHLAAVGVEAIRRWRLQDTGMSIWDDMAFNSAPMFSPGQFEKIFLPGYRRMIKAYRDAGAPHVFLHSDGNILPLLEMLVDAGIDGLNPLERRAGMDPALIRKRFPRLVLIGGMDNTDTLINGPVPRIEAEARELIDMGRDGGLVIGTHSVSPEIPLEHFEAYDRFCGTYGSFRAVGGAPGGAPGGSGHGSRASRERR